MLRNIINGFANRKSFFDQTISASLRCLEFLIDFIRLFSNGRHNTIILCRSANYFGGLTPNQLNFSSVSDPVSHHNHPLSLSHDLYFMNSGNQYMGSYLFSLFFFLLKADPFCFVHFPALVYTLWFEPGHPLHFKRRDQPAIF